MQDVRCKSCNRLLAKATVMVAAIRCGRCKMIFEYKVFSNLHYTNNYDIIDAESTRPARQTSKLTSVKSE